MSEPETTASAGAGSKTAPDPDAAKQLSQLRDRMKRQYQAGQRAQALETAVAGLALDRDEPELRRMLTTLDADAQAAVQRAKQDATKANAASRAAAEMKLGAQKESSAASLRKANRADEAIRSLWSAADSYSRAAERAGQVGAQLDGLAARARTQAQSGQRPQALDSALEGLKIDSGFTPLHEVIDGLWRDAQATTQRSKRQAEERGTSAKTSPEFAEALRRESDAARLGEARNMGDAVRSLWTASELFAKAAERPADSKPAEPAPPVKATEPPAVRPDPDKTPERPSTFPSRRSRARAKKSRCGRVLDDFIAAYERLDATAVKKIFPSVNDAAAGQGVCRLPILQNGDQQPEYRSNRECRGCLVHGRDDIPAARRGRCTDLHGAYRFPSQEIRRVLDYYRAAVMPLALVGPSVHVVARTALRNVVAPQERVDAETEIADRYRVGLCSDDSHDCYGAAKSAR